MAKLPYSRTVLVTLSRNDAFPSRRGFGTPLFLTSVSKPGKLSSTIRTHLYGSMDEVAADWSPSDDFYKAAQEAFAQEPRPIQIKAGYYAPVSGGIDDEELADELDIIYDYDQDWYWLCVETALRDTAALDGLIAWVEAKNKFAIIDSNIATMTDPSNTTNVAARHKGTVERTAVFYHSDVAEHGAFALAAILGTRNFDDANTAYTAKFKELKAVAPINKPSSDVTAITGFVPAIGQSTAAGHMANTQVDIGGRNFIVEGSTLTPNVFIDEIHATDWIIARTEEQLLGILLNDARIPFTDAGMEQLASAARVVMRVASRAGLIADDLNPETGQYEPSVTYDVPSVFDVPASQRKARIAPAITVRFRYAGAVHYSTINYQMSF